MRNEIVLSVSAGFIQLFVLWNMNFLWSLRSISLVLIDVLDLVSEPMSVIHHQKMENWKFYSRTLRGCLYEMIMMNRAC